MGTGEALVVESIANQTVKTQLTYTKPMEMQQLAEITLTPLSTSFGGNHPPLTLVRWQVTGKNNFVGRLFCLVLDMDKHVGGQFEKGLANLKRKMETPSNSPS